MVDITSVPINTISALSSNGPIVVVIFDLMNPYMGSSIDATNANLALIQDKLIHEATIS